VDSDCNIVVRAPYGVSQKSIDEFVLDKKKWLEKTVTSQLEKKKRRKIYTTEEIELLRKKAKGILPQKVEYYADIMGVRPKSVKINSAQKRYGSCSSENNINFSLYLMDKDERFIDYVVVHELAHIRHHNHSKDFYKLVERYMPKAKNQQGSPGLLVSIRRARVIISQEMTL
jgi:predicted metal-dependent hydrolase